MVSGRTTHTDYYSLNGQIGLFVLGNVIIIGAFTHLNVVAVGIGGAGGRLLRELGRLDNDSHFLVDIILSLVRSSIVCIVGLLRLFTAGSGLAAVVIFRFGVLSVAVWRFGRHFWCTIRLWRWW